MTLAILSRVAYLNSVYGRCLFSSCMVFPRLARLGIKVPVLAVFSSNCILLILTQVDLKIANEERVGQLFKFIAAILPTSSPNTIFVKGHRKAI